MGRCLCAVSREAAAVIILTVTPLLQPAVGYAQQTSTVTGVVSDTGGAPISGVAVTIAGTHLKVASDERGGFRIAGVGPGPVEVRARRLGFLPVARDVNVEGTGDLVRLDLMMAPAATTLQPVVVQASRVNRNSRLSGYYERLQRRSSGQFITRDVIDRRDHRSLSQLLAEAPGVNAHRLRGGGGAVRMRGRSCRPLVWLDGVPLPAGEVDLDAFPVSTLHGVELYLGSTTAPIGYTAQQNRSSCGTILLWSRGRDTDPPRRSQNQITDLESLVASLSIYTVDQVDRPAEIDSRRPLEVAYPLDLFVSRVSGGVMAEFIVDAQGKIEPETFAIVASSHPLFSAAVTTALQGASYTPAIKDGKPVRQVVQQPFAFAPGSGKVSTRY